MKRLFTSVLLLLVSSFSFAEAETPMSLKAGIGTDASFGLALGVGLNVDMSFGGKEVQVGPAFYYALSSEDSNNGFNDYHEETTTIVVGALVNYVIPSDDESLAFIYGFGGALVSVDYLQTSPTDSSIGPFNGTVYVMDESYTGAAALFNLGINKKFSENLELQFEMPIFMIPASWGMILAPAFTASIIKEL